MKIIVIHDEEGKKTAKRLLGLIARRGVAAEIHHIGTGASLESLLDDSSHLLAVCPPAPGGSFIAWLAFAAGFALASHCPLWYYGDPGPCSDFLKKAAALPGDEKDLVSWLEREITAWSGMDAQWQARAHLLAMGIPVNGESLADCVTGQKMLAVAFFLNTGFSPDTRNGAGVPLLCLAARTGSLPAVSLLLKAGAQVDLSAEDRGGTALIDAASGKYGDIAEVLLAAGADPNVQDKNGQSALIVSVGLNDKVLTELLFKAGARADDPDKLGVTARKYAALFHHPAITALFDRYAGGG